MALLDAFVSIVLNLMPSERSVRPHGSGTHLKYWRSRATELALKSSLALFLENFAFP
jgi:hypothetical protein